MAYPNTSVLNIIIPQTSASIQDGQAPFVERIISGSRLVLQTTIDGTLTGSSDLNVNSITASNISASGYISASNLYVKTNITDAGTLTVVGATTLAGLTGTTATFSGLVSASAGLTASAIQDAGTLTVVGNSILSTVFATNVTASNISASGFISGSSLNITNDGTINGDLTVNGGDIIVSSSATNILLKPSQVGALIVKDSASEYINITTSPTAGNVTFGTNPTVKITNANNATSYTDTVAALQVDGGARISKDTYISGSLNVAGDLTIFGSSSVVYISSSTVIINDNIIQLNAFFPFERYAGFEVYDSGSNQRSASLLWDGQSDNWTTVDQNNSASNIIIGPTASFGSAIPNLTVNRLTKAFEGNGITDSLLSDDGTTLRYTGNVISASSITASNGTITNVSGTLITYVTGSFTALTVVTGSSPGVGSQVPTSPTSAGMPGQIEVDNNFVYVYTNNIWKRVPLSTWSL